MAGFSRYHKYTPGTELRNASCRNVTLITQTNHQSDKQPGILALRDHLEELLLLIRIAKDARPFKSIKAYCFLSNRRPKFADSVKAG